MTRLPDHITISELAKRSGVAASALRYYESLGLIAAERTPGNQRRYRRSVLRRVALIRVAQSMGVTLQQIHRALATLPDRRDPTPADWARLSRRWHSDLSERIGTLERLRDQLSSCIGCGCLSLERCALYNADDRIQRRGNGPRYLLGDVPEGATLTAPVRRPGRKPVKAAQ